MVSKTSNLEAGSEGGDQSALRSILGVAAAKRAVESLEKPEDLSVAGKASNWRCLRQGLGPSVTCTGVFGIWRASDTKSECWR